MSDFTADKIARAYLMRVAEPPAPALATFVSQHGPIEAAERVKRGACPQPVLAEVTGRLDGDRAAHDLEQAAAGGTRLVTPEDTEWPAGPLSDLAGVQASGFPAMAPPLGLWVRGPARLNEAAERAISIVGSRASTGYGEYHASEFAYDLAGHGISIVAGASYGIDGSAHRGALHANGTTVAVLGCAIDQIYPAGHAHLLRSIAASGALVSEYSPGTVPGIRRFAARSRIVAALTAGTVVVEAGRHSGTRETVSAAEILGRTLMAMPGPVSSALSYGCHALIGSGDATLVASVDDILHTTGLGEPSTTT
ncbi:DNA-protecting protein DprA [Amycolatopsis roodepoortensis]|uniref:DNA-processing protein DprA n=1 Tax=Amycolatopsis roodepoortensis TaxID=700274 RepID=UPI00214C33F0|nr:DNA-processing protein DprA [Amycolatopsis roodepoortensis]UUV32100.1 DNA-protecting protein DprA [Amycolatopsis roodepoortensis]